jgi:hypothetical protein
MDLSNYSYGEWKAKFESNRNDFNIEICDFGLINPNDVGIPGASRRVFHHMGDLLLKT